MKSLKITVKHLRAFFFTSKNAFGFVLIIYLKSAIHVLKVSFKQPATNSLSMPSAQEMVLKHK
jgi:hypothetical protein